MKYPQTGAYVFAKVRKIVPHGFEPRSKPPEGFRIGRYPMGLISDMFAPIHS